MSFKQWTADEDAFITRNWTTRSDAWLAQKLDRTAKAVTKRRNDLRLIKLNSTHWTGDEIRTLCVNHDKSLKELSSMFGRNPKAISGYIGRIRQTFGDDWYIDLMPKVPTKVYQKQYISAEIAPELILAVRVQQMLARLSR